MDMVLLLALGSFGVSIVLAYCKVREYLRTRRAARVAEWEQETKAPAEREALYLGNAEHVIAILNAGLVAARADADRYRTERDDLRAQLKDLQARITYLERELLELQHRLAKEGGNDA